ncbi:MAG: sugar phosphate isomerase/epimerase family protein [Phycisphaerae bacterium]
MAKLNIALQLYTVRDLTKADFAGTLRDVAAVGYTGVELAGFGNLATAAEVRKALDDAGLKAVGAHVGLGQLETDLPKAIADAKTIGYELVVCPFLPDDLRTTAGYTKIAALLNDVAVKLKAEGLKLAYHNHAFEFETLPEGGNGMDVLFGKSSADVRSELDLYWVARGGEDPVAYVKKLSDRLAIVHLKDMDKTDPGKFAPVGTGRLDFAAMSDAVAAAGVTWGVVEQDHCYDMAPMDSIKLSFANLKKLGIA